MLDTCIGGSRLGVPCYCTHPDRHKLTSGGRVAPGAGSIALVYQELGGPVRWFGKPHPAIYEYAQRLLKNPPSGSIVCIGDSLEHDIAGPPVRASPPALSGPAFWRKTQISIWRILPRDMVFVPIS